jgi:proteasome accessory factor A
VAITQLILTMLEDDALRLGTDVMLADPVKAIKVISADPELKASVELEGGCRKASAIAIQRIFLEAAQAYLETAPQAEERWGQVWTDWHDVIHRLETEPQALDRRLDWRIKWQFLKDQAARRDIGWQHPTTRELDMRYHQLDRQKGFYYLLHEAGFVEDLIPDDDIRQALSFPPDSTRAYLRGGLAAKHHLRIIAANWEVLSLALSDSSGTRSIEVYLPDPLTPSRTTVTEIPDDPGALKQWLSTIPGLQSTLHSINSEGEHVRTPISETATSGAAAA